MGRPYAGRGVAKRPAVDLRTKKPRKETIACQRRTDDWPSDQRSSPFQNSPRYLQFRLDSYEN